MLRVEYFDHFIHFVSYQHDEICHKLPMAVFAESMVDYFSHFGTSGLLQSARCFDPDRRYNFVIILPRQ